MKRTPHRRGPPSRWLRLAGSPRPRAFLGLLLAWLSVAARSLAAETPTAAPRITPVTSVAELHRLGFDEARKQLPVVVTGVITYYEPRWNTLFVQDSTGGAFVFEGDQARPRYRAGQRVEIRGTTGGARPRNGIREEKITVLGTAPIPEPIPLDAATFASGRYDSQWVELEGTVRSWTIEFQRLVVDLAAGDIQFTAHSPRPVDGVVPADFVHSRVRVRGVASAMVDASGKITTVRLYVPSLDQYSVVVPAPKDPFALQDRRLAQILGDPTFRHSRQHVLGVVTLASPATAVLTDGALAVRLELARTRPITDPDGAVDRRPPAPELAVGDQIHAVGYLESDPEGPTLIDAYVVRTGHRFPADPHLVTAVTLGEPQHLLRLVTLDATFVAEMAREASEPTMRHWAMSADGLRFEALVPASTNGATYEPGSLLRLTGICERRVPSSEIPSTNRLRLRSVDDVTVLQAPLRWLTRDLLRLSAIGAAVTLAILGWALLLWREGGRQREINRQLESHIAERTLALTSAKEQLEQEIAQQRRAERIRTAIYDISEAVHATDDLQSLYRRIHDIVHQLTGARNFYIAEHDAEAGLLSFPYYVDEHDPTPPDRPLGRGFTEYVLLTGKPVLADAEEMRRLSTEAGYTPLGSTAALWLGVPLSLRGHPFGVLAVQEYVNPKAFGAEEKAVLEFVAEQVAIAIDRRRAMDKVRASEARLRESQERFSKGFRNSAGSLSIISLDTRRYLDVNEGFRRTYGYTREEALDRTSTELGLWPDPNEPERLERLLRRDGAFRDQEATVRRRDGQLITVMLSADVIDIGGQPCVVVSALDITDRKRAEVELRLALQREVELNELKSSFVSLVSHEFRTPLGVILSSAEILERYHERLAPEQRVRQLQAIGTSVRRMAHMMNEVLLLGRFDAGRVEFKPAPLDLAAFCRRVVDEVLAAGTHRCPIDLVVAPDLGRVAADESLLGHVLTNLLSNALKYSPEGSAVELSVRRQGDRISFAVADHGYGIPDIDRSRLFSAFHRGSNVGQIAGTGLGLVIVRRCMDLHGGKVTFTSEEGLGTTFTAEIPYIDAGPILAFEGPRTT